MLLQQIALKIWLGAWSVFINPQDVFEFGYWLIPSAQGQGIMTRSLERIEQLMAERGISNAEIWVEAGNERSQKLAVRNGYSEVRRDSQRASNPGVEHIVPEQSPQLTLLKPKFSGQSERSAAR